MEENSSGGQGSRASQGLQTPNTGPTDVNTGTGPHGTLTGTQFTQADEDLAGVLQPVAVEERGYVSSGNLSARTDTHEATSKNLSIDASHGWKADLRS